MPFHVGYLSDKVTKHHRPVCRILISIMNDHVRENKKATGQAIGKYGMKSLELSFLLAAPFGYLIYRFFKTQQLNPNVEKLIIIVSLLVISYVIRARLRTFVRNKPYDSAWRYFLD